MADVRVVSVGDGIKNGLFDRAEPKRRNGRHGHGHACQKWRQPGAVGWQVEKTQKTKDGQQNWVQQVEAI